MSSGKQAGKHLTKFKENKSFFDNQDASPQYFRKNIQLSYSKSLFCLGSHNQANLTASVKGNYNLITCKERMMKKYLRHTQGLYVLLLFTLFISGCSNSDASEATKAPSANLEESVQLTLTESAASAAGGDQPLAGESEATAIPTEIAGIDCSLPLPSENNWPVVLCETFDDNSNDWQIEAQDNPYARYTIDIQDGKYALNYTAKGFAGFQRSALTWFDVASADDFALSVTTLMNSDFQGCSWGVAFRADEDSFFLFSIYNDNTYAFEIYEDNGWIPLITQRGFDGIRPNEENKLTIIAEGGDFTFAINDEPVNTFNGGLLQESGILLITSAEEGASVDYLFDDLVLQVSP